MRISLLNAVDSLSKGKVVGVPTETVYGLAASLKLPQTIEKIFKLKNRPLVNPLIVHVATIEEVFLYTCNHPPLFQELAHAFWPGPLTCVLSVNEEQVPAIARAHLSTVGIRIPAPELTRQLLQLTGPLVMPSANLSGRPSSTLAEHVEEDFGQDFPVLDGGACVKGLESTILLYQNGKWVIGRLGALSAEDFEPILGYQPEIIQKKEGSQPLCPGQFFRHYAPQARLILGDPDQLHEASAIIGFKDRHYPPTYRVLSLGSLNCPEEVAEHLYQVLRQLDQESIQVAWVDMDFPHHGLWATITERLKRAGEKSYRLS